MILEADADVLKLWILIVIGLDEDTLELPFVLELKARLDDEVRLEAGDELDIEIVALKLDDWVEPELTEELDTLASKTLVVLPADAELELEDALELLELLLGLELETDGEVITKLDGLKLEDVTLDFVELELDKELELELVCKFFDE